MSFFYAELAMSVSTRIAIIMLGLAPIVFIYMMYFKPLYGKHVHNKAKAKESNKEDENGFLSKIITNQIPLPSLRSFPAFNARITWLIMESPCVWLPIILVWDRCSADTETSKIDNEVSEDDNNIEFLFTNTLRTNNLLMLFFFWFHYVHRSIVYPIFRMNPNSTPVPIYIGVASFIFCFVNAMAQVLVLLWGDHVGTSASNVTPTFYIGFLIAIIGMVINIHSDSVLIGLRSGVESSSLQTVAVEFSDSRAGSRDDSSSSPIGSRERLLSGIGNSSSSSSANSPTAKRQYRIPFGGFFRYVSAANLFGEILEWFGFAIAGLSLGNPALLPSLAFFVFTFANLAPRGYWTHRWYLDTFPDQYPKSRKAVIPFVW